MSTASESFLRVLRMHVIWRDTFIVDRSMAGSHQPSKNFLESTREHLTGLPIYVADRFLKRYEQTDLLRVIERASRSVARTGYENLLRFQFAPLMMANLQPTLSRLRCKPDALTPSEVESAADEAQELDRWIEITPMLLIHRAGVGIMEYLATWHHSGEGYTPDEAIELVRLGINTQLLCLPDEWHSLLPSSLADWAIHCVVDSSPGRHLVVAGLRDLSQILAAQLNMSPVPRRLGRRHSKSPGEKPMRPTGSATVVLEDITPKPDDNFVAYVARYAGPLRGIGSMDTYYRERASWIVERELADNLSTDSEVAVYLLGNSELILFNDHLDSVIASSRQRLGLPSNDLVTIYLFMHYQVLMEWTYLQEVLLRAYIQRLDALVASTTPQRSLMIGTLQGALADLVQYQENITPFATRVEFLERARVYHKLDELAERFEHKQEMLLNYASEYYDYRETRATEFLNWLACILTGAALADLIITLADISPVDSKGLYLAIMGGSILLVLAILAAVQRFL
ncbi:MAG: hypothetical protein JXB07_04285 [Anaerolineae bacterium]|nr:hypothetical protein [Anaerolineae bacterium]